MIRVKCYCGETLSIRTPDTVMTCRCGGGIQLAVTTMVWDCSDLSWCEAEAWCENCGKPMLDVPEPQPYIDVTLCEKCGGGKPYGTEQATEALKEVK